MLGADVERQLVAQARRLASWRCPVEDLVQEGRVGYWQALGSYDPAVGAARSTYCLGRAIGAMRHYVRDKGGLIRVPAWRQEAGCVFPEVGSLDAFGCGDRVSAFGTRDFAPFLIDVLCPAGGGLSVREREVLELYIGGRTLKGIGEALGIEFVTVATHLANVRRKMGVRTTVDAAVEYVRRVS